ncbi:MAG: RNA polymerase sigma factor [Chitinophagales bacterium]|nr:RNA polymerase sigma factor [Chitinophagales bacterium]MDW8393470.1 RNA polymerase sigma factor [Chitinophagales bacterium]
MTSEQYNLCVDLYADRLYRFVRKNLQHQADAEDVVQSAYEILWRNHQQVAMESSRSYLFRVAYRLLLKAWRRQPQAELSDEMHLTYHEQPTGLKQALDLALQTLPPVQKSVVLLRDYEGYSYAEIASIAGLSIAQVKVYLFRARKKLKDVLVSLKYVV